MADINEESRRLNVLQHLTTSAVRQIARGPIWTLLQRDRTRRYANTLAAIDQVAGVGSVRETAGMLNAAALTVGSQSSRELSVTKLRESLHKGTLGQQQLSGKQEALAKVAMSVIKPIWELKGRTKQS